MEFIMLLGGQVIDTLPVNPVMFLSQDYLNKLQEELKGRNEYMLTLMNEKPQFALENVPSKMNFAPSDSPVKRPLG